eukprot:jgi/Botrbrau1/6633/Bobra.104_2s0020.1
MATPFRPSIDSMLSDILPGPQRRVLSEMYYYFYPYGDTPAKNLISSRLLKERAEVLLLGCGDIRKLLWSASSSTDHIHFHLNDNNNAVLARDLLLLHILNHIDVGKPDDLHYLWNVWYNIFWDTRTRERFVEDVQSLLDSGVLDDNASASECRHHVRVEDKKLAGHLKDLLKWWLSTGLLMPVKSMKEARQKDATHNLELATQLLNGWEGDKATARGRSTDAFEDWVTMRSDKHALLMIEHPLDADPERMDPTFRAASRDVKAYLFTGVAQATAKEPIITSVNPTMLDSFTGEWNVHYDSVPHRGYPPIPHAVLKAARSRAAATAKPGLLTSACLSMLKKAASKYIGRVRSGAITVTLWGGDALSLCIRQLCGRTFDVIDTSNLGDHVGLLNVLAVVGPRLKLRPLARLFTETLVWQSVAESIQEYLSKCFGGVPPSMYPTLFGLRLLTDPELGRPVPANRINMVSMMPDHRSLEWCPAHFSISGPPGDRPVPVIPRVLGDLSPAGQGTTAAAASLQSAIEQLAGRCLVTDYDSELYFRDRSGIGYTMGTCLAYLLAGGFRKRWRLQADMPSVADALLALIRVPDHFRLEWRALAACISMAEVPGRPKGAPAAEGVPAAEDSQPNKGQPPFLLKGRMATDHRLRDMWADNVVRFQSVLRMLVGSHAAMQAVRRSSPDRIVPTALAHKMHFFDAVDCVVSEDCSTLTAQFLVPADHDICLETSWAILTDVMTFRGDGMVSNPTKISSFRAVPVRQRCFSRLRDGLGLRSSMGSAQGIPKENAAPDPSPDEMSLTIADCEETEDAYKVKIGIRCASEPSGVRVMTAVAQTGLSTLLYNVKLQQPRPAEMDLQLLHAVKGSASHAKLVKKKRVLYLDLPKSLEWPTDVEVEGMLAKDCADDLPDWRSYSLLGSHLCLMYDSDEMFDVVGNINSSQGTYSWSNPTVDSEVKEVIKEIFTVTMRDNHVQHVINLAGPQKLPGLTIRAHPPVRKASDGRPLLPLTVMDHGLAFQLYQDRPEAFDEMHRVFSYSLGNAVFSERSPEVLTKVTRILRKLSLRTEATKWQKANVPLDSRSAWFAVNLVPLYIDKGLKIDMPPGSIRVPSGSEGNGVKPSSNRSGPTEAFVPSMPSVPSGNRGSGERGSANAKPAPGVGVPDVENWDTLMSGIQAMFGSGEEGLDKCLEALEEMCRSIGFNGNPMDLVTVSRIPGCGISKAQADFMEMLVKRGAEKRAQAQAAGQTSSTQTHCKLETPANGSNTPSSSRSTKTSSAGSGANGGAAAVQSGTWVGCAQCGTSAGKLICARCRAVKYCSATCQRKHWSIHKPVCIPPA